MRKRRPVGRPSCCLAHSGMLTIPPAAVPPRTTHMQDATDCDLTSRLRQAEEAVRARDDFLAIASHELRSPLNALALRLAALERLAARSSDAALQEGLRRAAGSVGRYVDRALVLLDVSRLHAGMMVPAP